MRLRRGLVGHREPCLPRRPESAGRGILQRYSLLGHAKTCSRSTFSTFFARGQERCGCQSHAASCSWLSYLEVLSASDDKINQHLSICHELLDGRVDFAITRVALFQLRQLAARVCVRTHQIIDECCTSGVCRISRRSHPVRRAIRQHKSSLTFQFVFSLSNHAF